jgi:phosphoglycolate phosphatase
MPAPYRLAIFDFDGTLADSFALFAEAFNKLAARHGFKPVTPDEAQRLRRLHARDVMKQVGMPAWKLPTVATAYIGMMRARRSEVRLFSGAAEMLASLEQSGIVIAVVSSNAEDNVRAVLGPSASSVSQYACGMSIFGKRSHLRKVWRAAGVKPGEAIYIGDQAADLDAARAEAIDFGGVAWGFGDPAHLESLAPALMFRRMEDISARLALP